MMINTSRHKEYPIWRYAILYSELEGKLSALAAKYPSRMRFEKIGISHEGRDIFLVILAEDASEKNIHSYEVFRQRALWLPEEVMEDIKNGADYKIPLYFNCNIHGPEISGTDGMLDFIEEILDAPQPSVLKDVVILINICANPDGRCRGLDILNGHGFDLNRDFTVQSQPETRAIVQGILTRFYPSVMADFHGYMSSANVMIDACTPPHNPNTEYDLLEHHLVKNSEKMGEIIFQRLGLKTDIPARIWEDGWEDYSSVYTACFSQLFGCIAHTIEVRFPDEEGAASAQCAASGAVQYALEHKNELLTNQCACFLRGLRKESNNKRIPGYYIIPFDRAPFRDRGVIRETMEKLIRNGVKVFVCKQEDCFVIPTAQPLRGLIGNLLWKGEDISGIIENMYDVSFHSYPVMCGFEVMEADSPPEGIELIEIRKPGELNGHLIQDVKKTSYRFSSTVNASIKFVNYLMENGVEVHRCMQRQDPEEAGDFIFENDDRGLLIEEFLRFHDIAVTSTDRPKEICRIKKQKILIVADTAGAYEVLLDWGFDVTFLPFTELNHGYRIQPEQYDVLIFGGTKLGIWSDAYDETLGVGYGNTFALRERGREELITAAARFKNIILFGYAGVKLNHILGLIKADVKDRNPEEDQEDYADWHLNTSNGSFRLVLDDADPLFFGYRPEQTAYVVGPMALEEIPHAKTPAHFADKTFINGWCKNQEEFNGKPAAIYQKKQQGTTVLLGFDPCFRRYVDATFRIMANAVFLTGY
jgi:hypothetical protein